jgi:imidazolonepropionase-like amidohydrolase
MQHLLFYSIKTLAFSLALLFSSSLLAQSLYIKADSLVDVDKGTSVDKPLVIIEDGKITQIVEQTGLAIPEGAEVLDLTGHTLLPGLIDMHVHLTSEASNHGYKRLGVSLPRSTIYGVKNAKKTLMAGFTTVRNVGAGGLPMLPCETPLTQEMFQAHGCLYQGLLLA